MICFIYWQQPIK
uniref:Uncharacterized protein n=1 Tax=Anguilla anguilla TaxID=7936 RepID=A0A0E9UC44_ANGAN